MNGFGEPIKIAPGVCVRPVRVRAPTDMLRPPVATGTLNISNNFLERLRTDFCQYQPNKISAAISILAHCHIIYLNYVSMLDYFLPGSNPPAYQFALDGR